jgi:HK97 family phage major capsid protein
MKLKALLDKKAALVKTMKALLDGASANEDGLLTDEQQTEMEGHEAALEQLNKQIVSAEKLAEQERSLTPAAATIVEAPEADEVNADIEAAKHISVGAPREAERPFNSLADQLHAIVKAERTKEVDPRLMNAAVSGASEGVPADGGFLIQKDFASEIITRSYEIGAISSRVRKVPISANANGLKMNAVDETSRVTGSRFGGVQVYWEGEADAPTAKKPKFRQMELNLHKLIGLMYATDELLQDSTALSSVATQAFADEVNFMVEDSIMDGNGAGKPLGINNSNALVTVAKESGQAAATINVDNIVKMYSRMWARSRANAVWLINQDIEPQLFTLMFDEGNGGTPVYTPPGGLSGSPYGTLLGRPVIAVEHAQTLGTVGDISLVDLSQYLVIDKGTPKQDSSIHVRFVNDETAFRIVYRVDGQPIWNSALTPKNGSNTLSPFVNLATRA